MRAQAALLLLLSSAGELGWQGEPIPAPLTPPGLPAERPVGSYWEELPTPKDLRELCRRYICHTRRAGMAIDTDGWIKDPVLRRAIVADDPWHQDTTSYQYVVQRPPDLDPTVIPYVVIPKSGFDHAVIGDLAVVEYGGKTAVAVVGDAGPVGKFGEGSWRLATDFGIPNSGRTGGVAGGVTYTFLGGSGNGRARDEAGLLRRLANLKKR